MDYSFQGNFPAGKRQILSGVEKWLYTDVRFEQRDKLEQDLHEAFLSGCASGLCRQRSDDRAAALKHISTIVLPNQCRKKACKGGILKMPSDRNTGLPSCCMQCVHHVEQAGDWVFWVNATCM
ncbi:unnamed protein product [Polarella glacialis]|uniref:Uncharacterized protein n=1 Tax=Polarella glacialis TaxID=89957 RepID=A0A813HWU5_POLGL|nr:unnamed protein product [Polarella glacialis]